MEIGSIEGYFFGVDEMKDLKSLFLLLPFSILRYILLVSWIYKWHRVMFELFFEPCEGIFPFDKSVVGSKLKISFLFFHLHYFQRIFCW